mmetsp:Transcript_19744/g.29515  ORF Transcript_19744/g.29515 Transcript_19744/m.29515 type:complete len:232 (-) Transcript_19744:497-1192(-)
MTNYNSMLSFESVARFEVKDASENVFGRNKCINIAPATATLRDSIRGSMSILTLNDGILLGDDVVVAVEVALRASDSPISAHSPADRPFPSVPSQRATRSGVSFKVLTDDSACGSAATIVSSFSISICFRSSKVPEVTMGRRKHAPRAARIALLFHGSHVPRRRYTASHPNPKAVLKIVPRLPGSWIPSTTTRRRIFPSARRRSKGSGIDTSAAMVKVSPDCNPAIFSSTR